MTRTLGKAQDLSPEAQHKLHEMLGISAIKYFLLRVNPKKKILFNPKESIDFQGNTASFIQYTHARIRTILAKLAWKKGMEVSWEMPWEEAEKKVILRLATYRKCLDRASQTLNPALLTDYAYQLAKAYNHFYASLPIMRASSEAGKVRRLYLSWATADALKRVMNLLGMDVPEKM